VSPAGIAVDSAGDVFVLDGLNNVIQEIPYRNGNYQAPVTLGSAFDLPIAVATDAQGRLFVVDADGIWMLTAGN
jgi:hypothetical protein